MTESKSDKLYEELTELSKPFWDSLEKESDRAVAVIVGCLLDNILDKLLRAFFVKDPQVRNLFTNDHILRTFFAKINIAYFSGLISSVVYHDLKLIGEIRNRFAHEVTSGLSFNDKVIVQKINLCELRPKTIDHKNIPKLKFVIIVQQIIALIGSSEQLLRRIPPLRLVDILHMNEWPYDKIALTESEIIDVIRGRSKYLNANDQKDKQSK